MPTADTVIKYHISHYELSHLKGTVCKSIKEEILVQAVTKEKQDKIAENQNILVCRSVSTTQPRKCGRAFAKGRTKAALCPSFAILRPLETPPEHTQAQGHLSGTFVQMLIFKRCFTLAVFGEKFSTEEGRFPQARHAQAATETAELRSGTAFCCPSRHPGIYSKTGSATPP